MHARSTTIQARPSSIDEGIAHVRDVVLPELTQIEGCLGVSLLVDRSSGRCIATSSWQSEETMLASEDRVRPTRDRAAEVFGGTTEVERWEIVALHRDHRSREGACVRATWTQVDPSRVDDAIETFRLATLPAIEELEGFCSISMFIDRASGRGVTSVTYDSQESMERTREQAGSLRTQGSEQAGVALLDVGEFELALAHLRVPELA